MEARGARILNDCYNSNPCAAETMLELLAATPARRRIAVLGEMLELGAATEQLHRQVGRKAAALSLDLLVGVRGAARYLVEEAGSNAVFIPDPAAAGDYLRGVLQPGDVVLFKGSRGVKLELALGSLLTANS
jgi:UDP-N-acetylmuramoyl-tripeptide--D-alanyl-D-alanine ligase